MRLQAIYDARGRVLGVCAECGRVNYVEPHGTTTDCACGRGREHRSIPFTQRANMEGTLAAVEHGRLVAPDRRLHEC